MDAIAQTVVALGIVGVAAIYLIRRAYRIYETARAKRAGCGLDCGCD